MPPPSRQPKKTCLILLKIFPELRKNYTQNVNARVSSIRVSESRRWMQGKRKHFLSKRRRHNPRIGIARREWIESLISCASKLHQDFSAVNVAFMFTNSKEQRTLTKTIVSKISYSTHVVIIILALQNYWYFYRESKHRYLVRNFWWLDNAGNFVKRAPELNSTFSIAFKTMLDFYNLAVGLQCSSYYHPHQSWKSVKVLSRRYSLSNPPWDWH